MNEIHADSTSNTATLVPDDSSLQEKSYNTIIKPLKVVKQRRPHQRLIKTLREAYNRLLSKHQKLEKEYNKKSSLIEGVEDLLTSIKALIEAEKDETTYA